MAAAVTAATHGGGSAAAPPRLASPLQLRARAAAVATAMLAALALAPPQLPPAASPPPLWRRGMRYAALAPMALALLVVAFAVAGSRSASTGTAGMSSRELAAALRQRLLAGGAGGADGGGRLNVGALKKLLDVALQDEEKVGAGSGGGSNTGSGDGGSGTSGGVEDEWSVGAGGDTMLEDGDGDEDGAVTGAGGGEGSGGGVPLSLLMALTSGRGGAAGSTAAAAGGGDGGGDGGGGEDGDEEEDGAAEGADAAEMGGVAETPWEEEAGEGGVEAGVGEAPPLPARPPVASRGGAVPPPTPSRTRRKRPARGLTRADLLRRALMSADTLVPRSRPDEPPRRRRVTAYDAARRHPCNPEARYVHLLSAREGMSAWMHTLQETAAMAGALGRMLVEPCVAGGLLLPCTPGRVLPVPESQRYTDYPIGPLDDPLAVPAFTDHCGGGVGGGGGGGSAGLGSDAREHGTARNITPADGRVYPLSLYLDFASVAAAVAASGSKLVRFEDWVRCTFVDERTGRDALTGLRRKRGVVHADVGYCVSAGDGPLALSGARDPVCDSPVVGAYRFRRVWWPTGLAAARRVGNGTREHMSSLYAGVLHADARRDLFVFNVWRGFWARYGSLTAARPTAFNPIHALAVRAWLGHRLDVGGALGGGGVGGGGGGGGRRAAAALPAPRARAPAPNGDAAADGWDGYIVFQWRSETVDKNRMEGCARGLAGRVRPLLKALRAARAGAVLAADLPAPNNPCVMWHTFSGSASEGGARRGALATLAGAGLAKYDGDHPGVDAGVLSIRDWLLAVHARWYVTCHGGPEAGAGACRSCFRHNSKYVGKILEHRARTGRRSVTTWFNATPEALLGDAAGGGDGEGEEGGAKAAAARAGKRGKLAVGA